LASRDEVWARDILCARLLVPEGERLGLLPPFEARPLLIANYDQKKLSSTALSETHTCALLV
jgi:hypothetical protein